VDGHDDNTRDLVGASQALIKRSATRLVARGLRDLVARLDDVVLRGHVMWARHLNAEPILSLDDARHYVRELRLGGYSDWRLATREELQGLINPSELPKAVEDRRAFPFVEPFDIAVDTRVHSDTEIDPFRVGEDIARLHKVTLPLVRKGGHYVMRTFNVHVFNGSGTVAYVLAGRDILA